MMLNKKHLAISFFIFLAAPVFSQDYLDVIAEKSCKCMEKLLPDQNPEELKINLGLCMIDAGMPYRVQLKTDYNIDLDKLAEKEANAYGVMVAAKMAGVCWEILRRMEEKARDPETEMIVGTIIGIESDLFVKFTLESHEGQTHEFYWLSFIDSSIDLVSLYPELKGKSVAIGYTVYDLFDHRIKEYRPFSVIRKLDLKD
jgi:hypothetical protein